jgi:cytochrome P450 family 710 subfamily A protein
VHYLCAYPLVLARLRAEQASVRPDRSAAFTADSLQQLRYTWQVMREVLRLRPPATILPHVAQKAYRVSEEYEAPRGTLIVPSVWSSNRSGFESPEAFDPDRFDAGGRNEQVRCEKQFLTFGCGPHMCMGQRYAMNHIMLFISLLVSETEFERLETQKMEEIIYLPTIYPADGCPIKTMRARE